MQKDIVFNEFSPVSDEQWKNKIITELKNQNFEDIIWKTEENIVVNPFYHTLIKENPSVYSRSTWRNCEYIVAEDFSLAIEKAVKSLQKGAEALHFKIDNLAEFPVDELLNKIDSSVYILFDCNIGSVALAEKLKRNTTHKAAIVVYDMEMLIEVSKLLGQDDKKGIIILIFYNYFILG